MAGKDTPQIHLPITLDDELLIEVAALKSRIRSLLIGMEHNQYIMAKIFPNDLVGVINSEGMMKSPITVMYRSKGAVFRFETTIQQVVNYPVRALFLKYPDAVKTHCIPENYRYTCGLPAQTMLGNDIIDMTIVDISQKGCMCIINTVGEENKNLSEMTYLDSKINIMVQFKGFGGREEVVGVIRNVRKDVTQIQLGVMFEQMSPSLKEKIDDYIEVLEV
jgi:c-di-GMP-binding flagellar brake protein YcgR